MEEDTFPSKRRRKSSFFRKSTGFSDAFANQTDVAPSEIGTSAWNITNDNTISSRGSDVSAGQIEVLKAEAKQWKELHKQIKTSYQVAKSEELSPVDWLREGACLTEEDKKYLNDIPDYNGILAKYENLKESMLIEARTRAKVDLATECYLNAIDAKLQGRVSDVVKSLSAESVKVTDILEPLVSINDDSGYGMEPFLSDSEDD